MIQDCTARDFRCTLTRCPRIFAKITPPAVPPAGGRDAPEALAKTNESLSQDGAEGPRSMMTVSDVAAYLKVGRGTVYKLVRRDELRGFRIGGDWRFDPETVESWRLRHKEPSN
jgi:excisionase family DNA binding protein